MANGPPYHIRCPKCKIEVTLREDQSVGLRYSPRRCRLLLGFDHYNIAEWRTSLRTELSTKWNDGLKEWPH